MGPQNGSFKCESNIEIQVVSNKHYESLKRKWSESLKAEVVVISEPIEIVLETPSQPAVVSEEETIVPNGGRTTRRQTSTSSGRTSNRIKPSSNTAFGIFSEKRQLQFTKKEKKLPTSIINAQMRAEWNDMSTEEKYWYFEEEKILKAESEKIYEKEVYQHKFPTEPSSFSVISPVIPVTNHDPLEPLNFDMDPLDQLNSPNPDTDIFPDDLADITPTVQFSPDYPWKEAFESIGVDYFEF